MAQVFLSFECGKNVLVARLHSTLFCVSVMEGVWSTPFEFPRVPDDEELDGEMSLMGTRGYLDMVLTETPVCLDLGDHQVMVVIMET